MIIGDFGETKNSKNYWDLCSLDFDKDEFVPEYEIEFYDHNVQCVVGFQC